ncbi:uncharacterized protein FIBRA_00343 [Fibroporia radiculosa]|uniref:ABC transporter domain-containing protein n=1 Tax=Fibroporia radiculosa TaxID=599839 RepID=J7SCR4_9APHY|nr:uncharacterized protein FIBRA_00343 [Fibroporia radiculosa]CCL98348.1 predicted protein [Fibroporia radiculosa]
MTPSPAVSPLFVLRIVSPALVLLSSLSVIFTRPAPPQSPSPITSVVVASRAPRRALILSLLSLSALTFLLDGLTFVVYTVFRESWPKLTGIEINAVLGLAAYAGLAALGAWKDVQGVDVWSLRRLKTTFTVALALDIAQVVLVGRSLTKPLSADVLLHFSFPAFRVLLLVPLLGALLFPRVAYVPVHADDSVAPAETSLLLPPEEGAAPSTGLSPVSAEMSKYGTFRPSVRSLHPSGPTTRTHTPVPSTLQGSTAKGKDSKEDIVLDPSWSEIIARLRRIAPYLWPGKSYGLQILALLCIIVVVVGRLVNIMVPFVFAELVHMFEEGVYASTLWVYLFVYVGLRFLQSSGGLAALRETLWAPVMQYSDREMSQLSFDHLLNLSFAFHLRRKTGEILRILDRGAAVNRAFELLLFNVVPTFIDIGLALILFCIYFEWTLTLVVFFVMTAYISASVILTRWRTRLRRKMVDRDVVTRGIHTDCLLNYETVKYFCGEQHEAERYRDAICQYQALEYKVIVSLNLLNLVQNFILMLGLLIGSMIVAMRVTRGQSKPYHFVFFVTYLAQLYIPLNMLGTIYRSINQTLVDTEKLLKLLGEPTDVNDKPNAPDLVVQDGTIEFENVSFSYDERVPALSNISFKVPKGSSVALVGESGAGKSTILRLLYRFYDLKEGDGRILIDGQDIRDVTQASLRKAIGVVPQDSVLFNASISYNIGYGKFGASAEEIEAAAKAAQMHERIMSFPDGYETKVGERGVRLSGGEKQRVAIARTLLKNPPVLLLDEATSALDTATEKDIQNALQHLVQGRSSLSIAHRLSVRPLATSFWAIYTITDGDWTQTIASADLILVLKDGQIAEQGTHAELLALGGVFANMWAAQVQGLEDAASSHSHQKEAVSGYSVEQEPSKETDSAMEGVIAADEGTDTAVGAMAEAEMLAEDAAEAAETVGETAPGRDGAQDSPASEPASAPAQAESPAEAPVAFPSSDPEAEQTPEPQPFPTASAGAAPPLAFPSSDSPAPIAFPGSGDDAASTRAMSVPEGSQTPQAAGVTFQDTQTPPRAGTPSTPDPDGKRRRTLSTQGIQRLARRMSVSRRQDSASSIPKMAGAFISGLKREATSASKDDGSTKDAVRDSPTASVSSDIGKAKSKKDKKDKRKSGV